MKKQKLTARIIEKYFSEKGYDVFDIKLDWRHGYARLRKNNQDIFLKIAVSDDIQPKTKNEVSWNQAIALKIETTKTNLFRVPKIINTGKLNGYFYYLAEFMTGELLATKNPLRRKNLVRWLEQITEINFFILRLEKLPLLRDQKNNQLNSWEKYQEKYHKWYTEARKKYDVEKIFKIVKNLRGDYLKGLNHGDFVPWHMIENNGQIVLIDAEHASSLGPRYYDIAYFYHRVYTALQAPKLAEKYLAMIKKKLPEEEKEKFERFFPLVLATRILGGFWEMATIDDRDIKYHQLLKKHFD